MNFNMHKISKFRKKLSMESNKFYYKKSSESKHFIIVINIYLSGAFQSPADYAIKFWWNASQMISIDSIDFLFPLMIYYQSNFINVITE